MLRRQCLGQRLFHDAFQRRETMEVVRQSIVFHQSSVFGLEQLNDGEITVIDQFGPMEHFSAVLFVALTLGLDDFFWDAQSNVSIVTSSVALIALRVLLDGMDFVVEKPRCLRLGMSNQGFGLGKFELEFLLQEGSQALLDFFRFLLWANKSQQKIIGVTTEPESSIVRIIRNL